MSSYIYCDNEENGILSVVIEIMDNVFHFPHFNVQSFVASIDCLSNFKKKVSNILYYIFRFMYLLISRKYYEGLNFLSPNDLLTIM